jgi:hypothetical protein
VGDCCAAFDRAVHDATLASFSGVAGVIDTAEAARIIRNDRA